MKKPNLKAPNLKAPKLKAPDLGSIAGGSRTGQSLLAGAAVLAVVFGVAELRSPVAPAAAGQGGGATTTQVERTSLVCPPPTQGVIGSTTYNLFTPPGATATGGTGQLSDVSPQSVAAAVAPPAAASPQPSGSGAPAAGQVSDARVTAAKPGVPATGNAGNGESAPGAIAVATGAYAPGFTVTQTTASEQAGPALSGVGCTPSGTSFWFAGASTAGERIDYVTLVNAETVPAVVDIRMYGDKGSIDSELANGITVAPGAWQSIRLPGLTNGPVTDLAVHVVARSGRVGAGVRALDGPRGADWLQPSADPAPAVTIPGLPGDTASAHLVVAAPAEDDADLKVQVSGKNGWFTPAGHETVHVKAGMVTAVDLGQITKGGEASAIRLSPSDPAHPTPIVAGLRVDRTNKGKSDAAWISGAAPIAHRASIADNRAGQSQLLLTAVDGEAKVRVSSSAGGNGGTPAAKEVQIPAGATVPVEGIDPAGLNGVYGLTVEILSGGPVVAARVLTVPVKDVPAFTIQPLRDDRSTVRIPTTANDPGIVH